MILTVSGIIMSAGVGLMLFMLKNASPGYEQVVTRVVFPLAIGLSALAVYSSLRSSLLKVPFPVTTQTAMLSALMWLFDTELQQVTRALRLMEAALLAILVGSMAFVVF